MPSRRSVTSAASMARDASPGPSDSDGRATPTQRTPSPPKSTRKAPTCRRCGRPRKGHPRDVCPDDLREGSSAQSTPPPPPPEQLDNSDAEELVQTMDGLSLGARADGMPAKRRAGASARSSLLAHSPAPEEGAERRQSLPVRFVGTLEGLSHEEVQALDRLGRGNADKESVKAKVLRVKEEDDDDDLRTSPNKTLSAGRTRSRTPISESGDTEVDEPFESVRRAPSSLDRAAFLDDLKSVATAPPATVYRLPLSQLRDRQDEAKEKGLLAVMVSGPDEESDKLQEVNLVVGKDAGAVNDLVEGLRKRSPTGSLVSKTQEPTSSRYGRGKLGLAGGVVLGAAVAWAGLAFS